MVQPIGIGLGLNPQTWSQSSGPSSGGAEWGLIHFNTNYPSVSSEAKKITFT